jgi:hypothetical protein
LITVPLVVRFRPAFFEARFVEARLPVEALFEPAFLADFFAADLRPPFFVAMYDAPENGPHEATLPHF